MILSRCCKDDVFVESDYFVCDACFMPCDTIFVIQGLGNSHDDTGNPIEA